MPRRPTGDLKELTHSLIRVGLFVPGTLVISLEEPVLIPEVAICSLVSKY